MRTTDPSDRNFEIFCEVEHAGVSLRAAAAKYELSVARIQQIVAQVRGCYRARNADGSPEGDAAGVERDGFLLLKGRLTYLYEEAMDAWRKSQGEQTVEREHASRTGTKTVTTSTSFGQVRYLAIAMRIAETQCRATARHALYCERLAQKNVSSATTIAPPTGVYAREEEAEAVVEAPVAEEAIATPSQETSCQTLLVPVRLSEVPETEITNPMRSRLAKKLARHEKRKAARERKRNRDSA